jgi:serine/threonine protein kinase
MFSNIVRAMKEMSNIKALHRDIKNANILLHFPDFDNLDINTLDSIDLIKENVQVKLADFGFSTILPTD